MIIQIGSNKWTVGLKWSCGNKKTMVLNDFGVKYTIIDNNEKIPSARKPLNYLEIEKAAKYFGLDIDSKLIVQIFKSGDANRGERTPRQLRNGIFHSKAVKDIEEVEQRFEELSKLMETWLEKSRELIHRL